MCQFRSKIFIVRPVSADRPSSITYYLRGRYYTILGYYMLYSSSVLLSLEYSSEIYRVIIKFSYFSVERHLTFSPILLWTSSFEWFPSYWRLLFIYFIYGSPTGYMPTFRTPIQKYCNNNNNRNIKKINSYFYSYQLIY